MWENAVAHVNSMILWPHVPFQGKFKKRNDEDRVQCMNLSLELMNQEGHDLYESFHILIPAPGWGYNRV